MIGISKLYCGSIEPSDALRYGSAEEVRGGASNGRTAHPTDAVGGLAADPHGRSEHGARHHRPPRERKPVVVWNCTPRCNLRCVHCYSHSDPARTAAELSTTQAEAMFSDLAAFGAPVILFSGGEPLLRPDLLPLIERASRLGLRTVVSTNGTLLTPDLAARLRDAGIAYVGVSLDGVGAANDRFRGVDGAFERALAGIRHCRSAGVRTGLRFTVTRRNLPEVPGVLDLLAREGIPRACFYHLVYAGRGSDLVGEDLDGAQTRALLDLLIDRTAAMHRSGHPVEVLTVNNAADGPYVYLRMLREGHARAGEALSLLRRSGGDATGSGIACVSWDGTVHPSQFWRGVSLGNVTERPLSQIWTDPSIELLAKLRDKPAHVHGRCERCRFLPVCGGNSRIRAEAVTGDLWACDPACYLTDDEIAGDLPADR